MAEGGRRFLELRLLARGIHPRHAARMAEELAGHYEDLCLEAEAHGLSAAEAGRLARARLGSATRVAKAAASRPELRCFSLRHPRIARAALPVVYAMLLPVAPLYVGLEHGGQIVRWGASLALSAVFTAFLLLLLQLSLNLS